MISIIVCFSYPPYELWMLFIGVWALRRRPNAPTTFILQHASCTIYCNTQYGDAHLGSTHSHPYPTRVECGWDQNMCWISGSDYFHIYANKVGNLTLDLQRVRWIEELRLVRLFCFFGTHASTTVTIDGLVMSQNRWVYDQVTRVIPADRVAVMDRRSSLSGSGATFGLPQSARRLQNPRAFSYSPLLPIHPSKCIPWILRARIHPALRWGV